MKELALEDFKKLSSDKKSAELFKLLTENNRLLRETPSGSESNSTYTSSSKFHPAKNNFNFSPKLSRRDYSIFRETSNF